VAVMTRAETRARQVGPRPQSPTLWPWIIQRVTGVVLVVLLAVHIGVNHFGPLANPEVQAGTREVIVFSDVAYRMTMAFWWIFNITLLTFVLYHGLNGIRNIALDLGVKGSGDKAVTGVLALIGVAAFAFGIAGLLAFTWYR
jgi:succinate dehydrogenase / fumarate reductase, membrane anchor subunit